MIVFVIKNPDTTKLMIQFLAKIQDKKLHLQSVRPSSVQKVVCCSSLRIINQIPPHILQLRENKMAFKNSKKKFIKNALYSIREFRSGNHYEEQFKF